MCNSRNCFALTSDGAPIIRSSARWFIGNSTTSRRFSSPHKQHDDAVDAGGDAAVRRRSERERVQHAAELLLQHVLADSPAMANAFFITSGRWLRIAPDDKFNAVADNVVLDRLASSEACS